MAILSQPWLLIHALLAITIARCAVGVVLTASNTTGAAFGDRPMDISLPDSTSSMQPFSTIEPLVSAAVKLPPYGLSDALYMLTPSNQNNITARNIACISCDAADYPGQIGSSDVFNTALAANVTAILLFSRVADYCNVSSLQSEYAYIYSMVNRSLSGTLYDEVEAATAGVPVAATISFTDAERATNTSSASASSSSSSSGSNSLGATPTTAVAMIILYSITGVITALFLIVIITGAVRAHRHPERYGPRNIIGRPRQSRARGLARAMLDTLPIVKYGEREDHPKPADVELAENEQAMGTLAPTAQGGVVDSERNKSGEQVQTLEVADAQAAPPRTSTESARSGISPAVGATDATATATATTTTETPAEADVPGCSICTEDFEQGQDLRVLPCNHSFHPACIDPWLLNVSGTCPLCRIDLHPTRSRSSDTTNGEPNDGELPPPIATGAPVRIGLRESLLIGLGLGRVQETSPEERIQAVRRLRRSQQNQDAVAAAAEQGSRITSTAAAGDQTQTEQSAEEGRRRRTFRDRFGIRTRRMRGRGDEEDHPARDSAAARSGSNNASPPEPGSAEAMVESAYNLENDLTNSVVR